MASRIESLPPLKPSSTLSPALIRLYCAFVLPTMRVIFLLIVGEVLDSNRLFSGLIFIIFIAGEVISITID